MSEAAKLYLTDIRAQFGKLQASAERAMAQVPDAAFFASPDTETNSIAITVKHMSGNLRSRFTDFLTTDGEKPTRRRDAEFVMEDGDTREALMEAWAAAWGTLYAAVESLDTADLTRTIQIRAEPMQATVALNRALAHLAYHVGQIVLLAKHYAGPAWQTLTLPRAPQH